MNRTILKLLLPLLLISVCIDSSSALAQDASPRQIFNLEAKWLFHAGDIAMDVSKVPDGAYPATKAGNALGAAASNYDDTDWPEVNLPHDWAVATPFDQGNYKSFGYHGKGVGWYRRAFTLDDSAKGKHLELQFDGIAMHATVWVNGILVARNFCGYTGFSADITSFARFGTDTNEVAVRVDANPIEGWWYEGAGIYRHVRLVEHSAVHIKSDGVYANPVRDAAGKWHVPVEVALESSAANSQDVKVDVYLTGPDGRPAGETTAKAAVSPFVESTATAAIDVDRPELWSIDTPTLYSVHAVLRDGNGKMLDEVTQSCGFRTLRFDADKGFFLNDKPIKIKGTCNHQDSAGVGVAVPDSLWTWRLKKLKEMGSNAYRSAHNPPAKELLDAADRVGMLVMDENRNFNVSPECIGQLEWMVRRDRNHPSVFLWSVFNEEPMQGTEAGYEMVRRLRAAVRRLDDTRPVTAAISGGLLNDVSVAHAVDVVGFNYQDGSYEAFHKKFPSIPVTSSEDTSAVMTRGEYVTDKNQAFTIDSYDDQWQPWGKTHRVAWLNIDSKPYIAGGFVWTGFDYRGEPQPLEWPSTGSSFGIMDQCGFPKAAYWIHQAHWIKDRPILQTIPHWNWAGREGEQIKVMALTNAAQVELMLNGKIIERKNVDPYMMVDWQVPYQPGVLEAVAFDAAGKEVARQKTETTGQAVALRLKADRDVLRGDGQDAEPIQVEAIDDQGRVVPTAKSMVVFKIDGSAKVLGVGNGDPICHEPDVASQRSLYNGLAQLVMQTTAGSHGSVTVGASADGLKSATTVIKIDAASSMPELAAPPAGVMQVQKWRTSPFTSEKPQTSWMPSASDQNTWATIDAGQLQAVSGGRYMLARVVIDPSARLKSHGGVLLFTSIVGKAEIFIDGKLILQKNESKTASLQVPFPAGTESRQVVIIFDADAEKKVGFGGVVTLAAN